jgi:hypothetical protein
MSTRPVFALGLGVQKCGTTWLFHHLRSHPDTAFELNYAKELNLASNGYRRKEPVWRTPLKWWRRRNLLRIYKRRFDQGLEMNYSQPLLGVDRHALNRDFARTGAHHALFLKLAQRGVVGDISPEYALRGQSKLMVLRDQLEMDFEVRTFVIWRDPLDRLESALNHTQRLGQVDAAGTLLDFAASGQMKSWAWECNYEVMVASLDAVFPDRLELVYEELFGPSGQIQLDRLHAHLGIRSVPGDFAKRVNIASSELPGLGPELRASARAHLDRQYEVIAERLGRARLASIWNF